MFPKTTKPTPEAGFLNKWRTVGVAGNRDSFPEREIILFKTIKPSPETGFLNKWRTVGVAGNRDSFPEKEIILFKNDKTHSGDWTSK